MTVISPSVDNEKKKSPLGPIEKRDTILLS